MSQHGDEDEQVEALGNGNTGQAEARDKHRALVAVLKDALHPLNTQDPHMRRELDDFFECLEAFFVAMGIDDLDDGVALNETARLRVLKANLGSKARADLEGVPKTERQSYASFKKVIQERYLPATDDVHHLCELRQCVMADSENTKAYVNRLRAIASRFSDMPEAWRTKEILVSLPLNHKNGKVRDLFAEKMPDTIQKAEQLAESYEIRSKEKLSVDKFNAALGGVSGAVSVDGVAKGYWTNNAATGSAGHGCSNPACAL
jgi:hypothetical protein